MELKGKYGTAIIYNDEVEQVAISQIINLLNQEMAKDAHIRIMSDVHAGAGCVIGYTAKLTDKIVPNLIGVDIACGVSAWQLGKRSAVGEKFEKLDKIIRNNIPSGRETRDSTNAYYKRLTQPFLDSVRRVTNITGQNYDYVYYSLGTLGGGNHFIEIDKDNDDNFWLIIHTGSRNFGLQIAKYHQEIAEDSILQLDKAQFDAKVEEIKRTKKGKGIEVAINKLRREFKKANKATGLEYLTGTDAESYFNDMEVAQEYASINRRMIGEIILDKMYKMDYFEPVESVHNYINFEDRIIRKGAISAHKGEEVIIPLNMADGTIYGIGKGNTEWNNSAPHGAGRRMSRSKAKQNIQLNDFQKIMKTRKVWSTTIGKSTLDEAPQAYKKARDIIGYLEPTVEVVSHMKPVYNFKASE
jgi:RNA-splicing ligase RtcB